MLSIFFCRGAQEICKNMYARYYCRLALVPPYFMKFDIRGQLTDVITCTVKFLVDRIRGYGVLTQNFWHPQNCHFPLTCCVALTAVPSSNTVIQCWNLKYRQTKQNRNIRRPFCGHWTFRPHLTHDHDILLERLGTDLLGTAVVHGEVSNASPRLVGFS